MRYTSHAAAAFLLLALAGCNTAPGEDAQPAPETDQTMTAVVVGKLHDPEELRSTGGGPARGTWDLEVCLAGADGQPRPGRCGLMPVTEEEWNAHEAGDQVEVPDGLAMTEEQR